MKKIFLMLLGLMCYSAADAQLIHYFDIPQRFEGKNVRDTTRVGYTIGVFFQIQDTTYYLNQYFFPSGQRYFIFKLHNNSLIPIDSFLSDYERRNVRQPGVVVYRDTALINTGTNLYKWEPKTRNRIEDKSIPRGEESITALALDNKGRPIISYYKYIFATYEHGRWTTDTIPLRNDGGMVHVWGIDYFKDTMIVRSTEFTAFFIHNGQKVDSLQIKFPLKGGGWNYSNVLGLTITDSTIIYQTFYYYVHEWKNGQTTSWDHYKKNRFRSSQSMAVYNGILWGTMLDGWVTDSIYNLYYLNNNRWLPLDDEEIRNLCPIGDKLYVSGKRAGVMGDFAFVKGSVRYDNGNCKHDTLDRPIFTKINVSGKPIKYFSNDGYFNFLGAVGESYTITAEPDPVSKGFTCNTDSLTVYIGKKDSTYQVDFAQQLDSSLTDVEVSIGTSRVVRGRLVHGVIQVKNNSPNKHTPVKVKLKFDSRFDRFKTTNSYQKRGNEYWLDASYLNGFEQRNINFSLYAPHQTMDSGEVMFTVELLNWKDSFPTNDNDTTIKEILRPYDPNAKTSYPSGPILKPIKKIDYTIEFQNIGSAEAVSVKVIDTLDLNLPVEFIRVKATSHPKTYHLTVKDNMLIWDFKGINLPDSASDPEGSKGFISYEAVVTDGFRVNGDHIKNRAFIYFDYEDAIETNTAIVFLDEELQSAEDTKQIVDEFIVAYPNPFSNGLQLENTDYKNQSVEVYNSNGQVMRRIDIPAESKTTLSTEHWPPGMYYLKTASGKGLKLIKVGRTQ